MATINSRKLTPEDFYEYGKDLVLPFSIGDINLISHEKIKKIFYNHKSIRRAQYLRGVEEAKMAFNKKILYEEVMKDEYTIMSEMFRKFNIQFEIQIQ